jgi:hypothetical protein
MDRVYFCQKCQSRHSFTMSESGHSGTCQTCGTEWTGNKHFWDEMIGLARRDARQEQMAKVDDPEKQTNPTAIANWIVEGRGRNKWLRIACKGE